MRRWRLFCEWKKIAVKYHELFFAFFWNFRIFYGSFLLFSYFPSMYPIPSTETLIETKICRYCQTSFPITDKDLEFYEKVSPTFGWKKYSIPTPTLCPDCRQQRRLSFRNERKLYKRKCDATGQNIISIYSPDKPFRVYHQDYWWSDAWDPMDYGRDFDFGRGFFEQFGKIANNVAKMPLSVFSMENSDYTNQSSNLKNCYLVVNSEKSEDCYYGSGVYYSSNCIDCLKVWQSVGCYECIDCKNCYNLSYSQNCSDCRDSQYLQDCKNCLNCFGCENISGKQYWIFNEPYNMTTYFEKIKEIKWSRLNNAKEWRIRKNLDQLNVENSIGNYLYDSKSCFFSSDIFTSENLKYTSDMTYTQNTMDVSFFGVHLDKAIDSAVIWINAFDIKYCYDCWDNISNLLYCFNCVNGIQNCFWCIGLRNKSYCILNRQYTKDEYEVLVPKIIEHMMKTGEWWEFFPSTLSPFWYNETVAQEYYPLTREEIIPPIPFVKGEQKDTFLHWTLFNYSDYEAPFPKVEKIIPASKLPDDITKIPDDILNWAIECEVTKKPFRIIKQELEFYRKHSLPIPRRHPDQRHLDRMALRNPRKLFERKCDCPNCETNHKLKWIILNETNSVYMEDPKTSSGWRRIKMITTYSPERKEIVYCEECYSKEVVG